MPKPHFALLVTLLLAFGVSYFSDRIDPYYLDVLIGIGINIILAVSLNLVNGYTGQFSLGHAGFMAVGAYASASWSNHLDPISLKALGGPANPLATNVALLISMMFGAALAAIAG